MSRDMMLGPGPASSPERLSDPDLQAVGNGRINQRNAADLAATIVGVQLAGQAADGLTQLINQFEGWWQTCDRKGVIPERHYLGALAAFERGWHDWAAPGVGITPAFRRFWHSDERCEAFGERDYVSALISYQHGWLARAKQQ